MGGCGEINRKGLYNEKDKKISPEFAFRGL